MVKSLRLFELGEARLYAARTRMHWGIICRDRGNTDAAREHFEKAAAQWRASNIPWELERVNKLIAELPKAQGIVCGVFRQSGCNGPCIENHS
jgi:hypothetical protein